MPFASAVNAQSRGIVFANPQPFCPTNPLGESEPGDRFGFALALGDFDGDGALDLAVGAPGENQNRGAVFLYDGFFPNPKGKFVELMPGEVLFRHHLGSLPANIGDELGYALVAADFNGDGFDDLAMGVPGANSPLGSMTGRVYVGFGSPHGLDDFQDISPSVAGVLPTGADRFGWALAAGDVNGDGRDDLAIGAPGTAAASGLQGGAVHVLTGDKSSLIAWATVSQETPLNEIAGADHATDPIGSTDHWDEFGASMAFGDFNNDGRDDLVVGAPGDSIGTVRSGAAYVFLATDTQLQGWARLDQEPFDSNEQGDGFGFSVTAGNFKTSSLYFDEIVVGAPFEDLGTAGTYQDAGAVYTFEKAGNFMAPLAPLYQTGASDNESGDQFGYRMAPSYDGDGRLYLSVTAPGDNRLGLPNVGEVLAFRSGPSGVSVPSDGSEPPKGALWYGTEPEQRLGISVAGHRLGIVAGHYGNATEFGGVRRAKDSIFQETVNTPPHCNRSL